MKRVILAGVCASGALVCGSIYAETPALPYYQPIGQAPQTFESALSEADMAIEMTLNAAADKQPAQARHKRGLMDKATVSLFGSIRNNAGSPLCALVLANGQFMFSCAPTGSYSLDFVPLDGSNQFTLFGFAEGHFPYKRIDSFGGRIDMTLNVASNPTPPPVTTSVITFNITDGCNNGISIDYKFYDETNNLVWPSATTHYYTTAYNATYTHNLTCQTNAKVCYGAHSVSYYWGVDVDNSQSCADCCIFCTSGNSLSRRLNC